MSVVAPRVVVVSRSSEFEEVLAAHATPGQAAFFLRERGRDLDELRETHEQQRAALTAVSAAIPLDWRRGAVRRDDLDRFAFDPGDLVVAVGQDGLVANVAKYLLEQPVIGIATSGSGVLTRHPAEESAELIRLAAAGRAPVEQRTMVAAQLDDGQQLVALNEVFVGHRSHQSARYRLRIHGADMPPGERPAPPLSERQSSSGLIVGTGTGSTGWCASLATARGGRDALPAATSADLAWFVREAWPSATTGADLVAGLLQDGDRLVVEVESDGLVVFGDGVESDRLSPSWGQRITVRRAHRTLALI